MVSYECVLRVGRFHPAVTRLEAGTLILLTMAMHSSLDKMMIIFFGWKPDFADGWRM